MCSKNCVNFLKSHGAWQAITDDPLYKSREIQNVKKFKTSQSIVWKWTCHQLWAFDTSWPGQGVETMLQAHDFVREGIQLEWWLSIFRAAYTLQRYFQFVCTSTLVCVKHACGKLVQAKEGGQDLVSTSLKMQTKNKQKQQIACIADGSAILHGLWTKEILCLNSNASKK